VRLTAITLAWADADYTFDLPLKQVRILQEITGVGPGVLLARLQTNNYKVDDFRETILQGLIGGGMGTLEASTLVKRYVDGRPACESLLPAQAVLMAWIMGAPRSEKKKRDKPLATRPDGSTSPESTEPEPR
jgi:hypothetical protein